MKIGECAFDIPAPAAKSEPVVCVVDDLLDGEGDEEPERSTVCSREGLNDSESVTGTTGALETHLTAYE